MNTYIYLLYQFYTCILLKYAIVLEYFKALWVLQFKFLYTEGMFATETRLLREM